MYKHILIPTDGSTLSDQAVEHGIALAKRLGAKVTGVTVTTPFPIFSYEAGFTPVPQKYEDEFNAFADSVVAGFKKVAASQGVQCNALKVEHEHPYLAILSAAKREGCDLILMASHGRRGISAVVLGSETQKVLTHSTIPVLVYRGAPSA